MKKSSEIIRNAVKSKNMLLTDAASMYGWTRDQLSKRMVNGTMRADDFIALMDKLGYEIVITEKETGETLKEAYRKGYGHRVKGVADFKKFDTEYSNAISNSFYSDGEHEYGEDGRAVELYIDKDGIYFFAEYSINDGEVDRVRSAPKCVADAFREKYGTDLHLNRKTSTR